MKIPEKSLHVYTGNHKGFTLAGAENTEKDTVGDKDGM